MSPELTSQQSSDVVLCGSFCGPNGHPLHRGSVAQGAECRAFRLWIDALPPKGHEALLQLRQNGFAYDLDRLEAELRRALQTGPAGPVSRLVGQRLLELLAAREGASCFLLEEAASRLQVAD